MTAPLHGQADKTISVLEAQGYTHIRCICRCRHCVDYPFVLIRKERPRMMLSAMTLAELAAKMRCEKCGARDFGFHAWRQSDANGFALSR